MSKNGMQAQCRSDAERDAVEAAKEALEQLAALQAANAELKKRFNEVNDFEKTQCAKLLAKLSRVGAERDAAISDIKRCCDTCMWYQADSGSAVRRCRRVYEPSACMECINWQ